MREIVYRLDVGHNFLKIDASENFYLRPNGDNTQKVFMLPQSYTINCRRLLLRESSLNPQWFLDLLFYVDESDTRQDSEILEEFFKFSSYDVAFDADNVSSSGQNVFVSGVNGESPYFAAVLNSCLENNHSMADLMAQDSVDSKVNLFDLKQSIDSFKNQNKKNLADFVFRDVVSDTIPVYQIKSNGDFYNIIDSVAIHENGHPLLLSDGLNNKGFKFRLYLNNGYREKEIVPVSSSNKVGYYIVAMPSGWYRFANDMSFRYLQSDSESACFIKSSRAVTFMTVFTDDVPGNIARMGYNYGTPRHIVFSDALPLFDYTTSILSFQSTDFIKIFINPNYPLLVQFKCNI